MKYLVYNDISYIIHHKFTLIMLVLLLPVFPLLLNIRNDISTIEIVMKSMGTNLSLDYYGIIEVIMYLFNLFWFLYLISEIYTKDLSDNLENIFLRIKPIRYILKKNICFIIITICIKLMQYIPVIGILMISKNNPTIYQLFRLIFSDISYILLVQYIFLFAYLIYILLKKNILFLITAIIILIVVIPKSIWNTWNYLYLVTLLLIFINILICWIFFKYSKSIIEKI